eukprot:CAMPEP_0194237956 /NCGR_PEP_ID=MMETSP0158-20130606/4816_1 /TAXON_ID=33649 /ORGANISM="Thalassionema nitzschioides, Strain L26-B" /LENGTH=447 /DNA_ID=CAMNT_0038972097 /DNA_START=84 /DNA_END=1427 /DNA_ORIENTATION=-
MSREMTTEEENDWREAAAAFDDGKGLRLEEYNPDDNEDMQLLYQALKVNDPHAKKRLKGYIRRLRQQQKPQVSQFSETAMAGLERFGEDYTTKRRTIVLSEATYTSKTELMDMLGLPEDTASWLNKPALSQGQPIDGYSWQDGNEDSSENRTAYMAYLNNLLKLPEGYALADMQPHRQLLTVELLRETTESRKIRGTTDVAIARSESVRGDTVRNNIETLFELKKVEDMNRKDHTPQIIIEHFAASYLNVDHPVVSVLTDLNKRWTFFWFAKRENDKKMVLYRLPLDGEQSKAEAKYILDSMYDSSLRDKLPTTFANRQSFGAVWNCVVQNKRQRRDFDRDDGDSPDQDTKPSPSDAADRHSNPGTGGESSSTSRGTGHQTDQFDSGGGGADAMSKASALSLFAPPAYRDVANELDLLDFVDVNEQYEIVRSFAEKHIVPYMRAPCK